MVGPILMIALSRPPVEMAVFPISLKAKRGDDLLTPKNASQSSFKESTQNLVTSCQLFEPSVGNRHCHWAIHSIDNDLVSTVQSIAALISS